MNLGRILSNINTNHLHFISNMNLYFNKLSTLNNNNWQKNPPHPKFTIKWLSYMKNYKLKNSNTKNYNLSKMNYLLNWEDKNKKLNNSKLLLKINGTKTIWNIKHYKNNSKYLNSHTINFLIKSNKSFYLPKLSLIPKVSNSNKKYSKKLRKVSLKDIFILTLLIIYKTKF